jgi:uncharacterized membrane protein (DUF441 family)
MNAIKPILVALFSSKKFLALLAGVVVWLVSKAGLSLTDSDVTPILLLIGGYIGAQGLADIGKEKIKEEVKAVAASKAAEPEKPSA